MSTRVHTAIAVSIAVGLGTVVSSAQAAEFEGTVVAKDKGARTFTVKQDEGGGTFKFKVNDATRYERIAGFAAISVGAKNIDVTARKKANGRWIAVKVERSGKADGGGNGDDGPNHT